MLWSGENAISVPIPAAGKFYVAMNHLGCPFPLLLCSFCLGFDYFLSESRKSLPAGTVKMLENGIANTSGKG